MTYTLYMRVLLYVYCHPSRAIIFSARILCFHFILFHFFFYVYTQCNFAPVSHLYNIRFFQPYIILYMGFLLPSTLQSSAASKYTFIHIIILYATIILLFTSSSAMFSRQSADTCTSPAHVCDRNPEENAI